MHHDAVAVRGLPHGRARAAVHRDAAPALPHHLDGPLRTPRLVREECGEPPRERRPYGDPGPQPRTGEVRDLLVRQQAPGLDGDHSVGDPSGLLRLVRGHQHDATLAGVPPQQSVQPGGFARREALRRLVEHQGVRVTEERRGEIEAPFHAE